MLGLAFLTFSEFACLIVFAAAFGLARGAYLKFTRRAAFDEILADMKPKSGE